MAEGLVGGEGFAVDASLIVADAQRQRGVKSGEDLDPTGRRAVAEYLATLDDAAFGAATPVEPKFVSPVDPAARWTASWGGPAVFAYCTNYLVDVENAIIVDVENLKRSPTTMRSEWHKPPGFRAQPQPAAFALPSEQNIRSPSRSEITVFA